MWKAIKAIALFLMAQVVFILLALVFSSFTHLSELNATFVGLLLSYVAVILYFCFIEKIELSSNEFKARPLPTLALCVCIVPFMAMVSVLTALGLNLPDRLDIPFGELPVFLAVLTIGVLGPVAEELVFRGAVLGSLLKWNRIEDKPWIAILLSALIFSVIHLNPAQVPTTLILGLLAGWLYFRTGSLVPGIVLHVMNNSAACSLLAIPDDVSASVVEDWEPSIAFMPVFSIIALTLFSFLLYRLVKVVNRDMPVRSIWSSTNPNAGIDKVSALILSLCSVVFAALFVLLPALRIGKPDSDKVLDSFGNFQEGLAYVMEDGKAGFIDREGKTVIPGIYDGVSDGGFHDGLCCVIKDGLRGYIDRDGKVVIPIEYSHAEMFSEGLASTCKEGKYGYIDKEGNAVIPFEYEYAYAFHDGMAMVSNDDKYGFVDDGGNLVVPIEYESASLFRNGLSIVSKDLGNGRKYGCIDSTGNVVIPLQYEYLTAIDDSLFIIRSGEEYGVMNRKEKIVLPIEYQSVIWYSDGLAMVRLNDRKSALVDTEGKILKRFNYEVFLDQGDGLTFARKGEKFGCVDSEGKVVIPFRYDGLTPFKEGLAKACKGKHRYYIDRNGEIVIRLD